MIRVKIEIVPFGLESKKRDLATITIANVTDGESVDGEPADYEVRGTRLFKDRDRHESIATVSIKGFMRGRHATELVAEAIKALGWSNF